MPTDPQDPPAPESQEEPPEPVDDAPLAPEGEKALEAWKARAKAAEKEAKRLADLEVELAKHREDAMSEQEKAIEQARREAADAARAEVLGETSTKLFRSELRAATTNLTDKAREDLLDTPEHAVKLLGFDEIPVTDTGDIDSEAISQAVASYVEQRPYLAASATPPAGSADQGPRTPPKSKGLEEQIADAEAAADWDLVGRLKLQKLAALPRP